MILLVLGIPLAAGGLAFALTANRPRNAVLVAAAALHSACVAALWLKPPADTLGGFLGLDSFGAVILTILSLLFLTVSFSVPAYIQADRDRSNRTLTGCLLFLLFAMTLVTLSRHLGLFWVAVEATTLASAPLINYHQRPAALEATWKYLLICSVGIALALLGTFFLAISAMQIRSMFLADLVNHASELSAPWLKLGVIFLTIGYGTKMGLVPMHGWKPDAYGEAPGPVGALLSGGLTNCAFLAFLKMSQICHAAGQSEFLRPILVAFGIASIALAAFLMLGQVNFNRLLAYSSIEHMGILVFGLGTGGLGLYGSMYHAVNNAFSKGLIFLAAGSLYQKYGTKRIADIRGVLKTCPVTGGLLAAALFAVTGIPPFGTFFSEFMILVAALAARHYALAFFYLLFLSIAFIAMASAVLGMVRGPAGEGGPEGRQHESWGMILPCAFLAGLALLLGISMPPFLSRALQTSSALLGG